ncbi:MAG: hypothetical protein NTU83_04960, partial [Candidatus Hydrogenedentes bacterium]|nr:hypothetical protein [Candidatus Hydrogenedentota bacterium]
EPIIGNDDAPPAVVIKNPNGALIAVNCTMKDAASREWKRGRLTARSAFDMPLPIATDGELHLAIRDADGNVLAEKAWTELTHPPAAVIERGLQVWPTPAYASFDERRLTRLPRGREEEVAIRTMYMDEVDQGANEICGNNQII